MSRTSILFGRTRNMPTKHDTIFGASGRARLPHQSPLLGSSLRERHDSMDRNRSHRQDSFQNRTPTHARTSRSASRLAARKCGIAADHSRMTSKHDSRRRRTFHRTPPTFGGIRPNMCAHMYIYTPIDTYYESQ